MKILSLLPVLGLLCAGCSDSEGPNVPAEPVYEPTETSISIRSLQDGIVGAGALDGFHLELAYNTEDACQLDKETYAEFEIYSGKSLKFIDEDEKRVDVFHMTEENLVIVPPYPGTPQLYDHYQLLPVSSSGEGEYDFALKLYQPQSGRCFITPRYRMKLALLEGSKFKITAQIDVVK